ncbi:MAG: Coenzyme F420 hydrogenase/dehydrogenase, beta subunit C-terminal domain [Candidatus Bathyarchaeia archaeon]
MRSEIDKENSGKTLLLKETGMQKDFLVTHAQDSDNIADVVQNGLCTGCGTCVGVCPEAAVTMHVSGALLLPKVREDACTHCRLCLQCCAGYSLDFDELNAEIFGKRPEDRLIGNFLGCYVGHSTDDGLRLDGSSGGVATQLLLYAQETGVINGALVVGMRKDEPLVPEPFIARTREEMVSASKSKYCPVATNTAVNKILSEDGKFAVVGLPCHIHGIRKAERVSKSVREKIVLHVGLFCGHTVNFAGTELLLNKLRIGKNDVARIEYRGCGHPSFMSIQLKNGRTVKFRFNRGWNAYWNVFSSFLFTPLRCMTCPDQFNELSDVSLGDAWLPELGHGRLAESAIITRTPVAEEMISSMRKSGVLSVRPVPPEKIRQSQSFSLNFKKEQFSARASVFRVLGHPTPWLVPEAPDSRLMAFVGAFFSYLSFRVSSSKRLSSVLLYVPLPLFRVYFGVFKSIYLLSS